VFEPSYVAPMLVHVTAIDRHLVRLTRIGFSATDNGLVHRCESGLSMGCSHRFRGDVDGTSHLSLRHSDGGVMRLGLLGRLLVDIFPGNLGPSCGLGPEAR
jgi:hypothetical protein